MKTLNRFPLLRLGLIIIGALGAQACQKDTPPAPTPTAVSTPAAATPAVDDAIPPAKVAVDEAAPTPAHEVLAPTVTPFVPPKSPSIYELELDLETQASETVKLGVNHGNPVIISMFYASCPAVCPTLIRDLKRIDEALAPNVRAQTHFLLVTFDPVVDTPEKLKKLAADHGVTDPRWTFARAADDDATRELATALGIRYRAVNDGHFNHSTLISLLDRTGRILARIDGLNQDSTAFLATLAATP